MNQEKMSFTSSVSLNSSSGSVIGVPLKEALRKTQELPVLLANMSCPQPQAYLMYTKDGKNLFKAALTSKIVSLTAGLQ